MPSEERTEKLLEQMGDHLSYIRSDMNSMKIDNAKILEHSKHVDEHLVELNSKVATNVTKLGEHDKANNTRDIALTEMIGKVKALSEHKSDAEPRIRMLEKIGWSAVAIASVFTILFMVGMFFATGSIKNYINEQLDQITANKGITYASD